MATIRKRGRKWHVQVRKHGAKSVTRSFVCKRDAHAWATKTEATIALGESPHTLPRDYRVADLLERYLREITPMKKGREPESRRLRRLLRDPFSTQLIASLDGPSLCKFRDRRAKDGLRACQYDLVLLRHAIEIGRKEWGLHLSANPVDQIRVPNGVRSRERRLEMGEYQALKAAAQQLRNPWTWPAVELALETAMRRSELLKLSWANVDLEGGLAHLPDTKNGHPRVVPLTLWAKKTLQGLTRETPRILPTTEHALRQSWERLLLRAGVIDFRFHDLRHEAISRFFERGLSLPEVALIGGHRDARMLFRYTHLKAEDLAKRLQETAC